ncbi:hypothetical protein HOLleu_28709 [Holothuria leucospilota]|uniref:Uncharacterized protein n=1 Tax=Holothuria leucospilota TaxID=206669 RepID=A0A9Q1H146_HOLLE|nr:hypothetical protein HOLleu_28709 [Holothuria leucospilota]
MKYKTLNGSDTYANIQKATVNKMDSYSIWVVILVSSVMCLHSCLAQTNATGVATEVTTSCCDGAASAGADVATDVAEVVTSQTVRRVEPSQTVQALVTNQTAQSVKPSQTAQTTTTSDPKGEPEGEVTTEKSGSSVTSTYMYWSVTSFVTLIVMTLL